MEPMEKYPFEYVKPFLVCFDLLNRSGIRMFTNYSTWCLIGYWYSLLVALCSAGYIVSLIANVFNGNLEFFELAYSVPVLLVSIHGMLKSLIVISYKSVIKDLIDDVGSMWRTTGLSEDQINTKNSLLKKVNFSNTVYYWVHIIGTWQYCLAPLFETVYRKLIMKQESDFLFPFACSYPFDPTRNWFIYIGTYVFQIFSMSRLVYLYLGAEILMITLCAHLSIEFLLLQENLLHVKPMSNNNAICDVTPITDITVQREEVENYNINDIVIRHQTLLTLCQRLDDIFNKMIFVNLLIPTITICFLGFVVKFTRRPTDMINNFIGVVASILGLFKLCYYGEMLSTTSSGMANSAYESLWYECNTSHQKVLLFIILRAQKPCYLTSLKYAPVTLNTFSKVLSTAWSYFSLVTSVYERK